MQKQYYKLKDVRYDIVEYKKLLRQYSAGTPMHKDILAELKYLQCLENKLIKRNKGNRAFFDNGIPSPRAKKQKSPKDKREQFLQSEIRNYQKTQQEIQKHLSTLTDELDSL